MSRSNQYYTDMSSYTVEGIQKLTKVVSRHDAGTGRIYLPKDWIGEEVEIIRTGRKVKK